MQLEGTLGQFPLAELINIIVSSSVTGTLVIGDRTAVGQMFCRDGRFYHAHTSTAHGFEAVGVMLALTDAPFQFTAGVTHPTTSIDMRSERFVEQIETLAQQWSKVHQRIHGTDWVPVACVGAEHTPEHLSKATRTVFVAMNGQRTVAAIAERLGLSLLETSTIVSTLVAMELVSMEAPRPVVATTITARQSSRLERLLAKPQAEALPLRSVEPTGLIQRLGFSRR